MSSRVEQKEKGGPMFEKSKPRRHPIRAFARMHSCKWRTPVVARYAACVTARKSSVRFIAHSHAHPSKLRNLAICAHIGGQLGTLPRWRSVFILCRLRKNYSDRIHPPQVIVHIYSRFS